MVGLFALVALDGALEAVDYFAGVLQFELLGFFAGGWGYALVLFSKSMLCCPLEFFVEFLGEFLQLRPYLPVFL